MKLLHKSDEDNWPALAMATSDWLCVFSVSLFRFNFLYFLCLTRRNRHNTLLHTRTIMCFYFLKNNSWCSASSNGQCGQWLGKQQKSVWLLLVSGLLLPRMPCCLKLKKSHGVFKERRKCLLIGKAFRAWGFHPAVTLRWSEAVGVFVEGWSSQFSFGDKQVR